MTAITVQCPAKLNLGLAVTGRRADGFHDLVTIFQTIDLEDTLTFFVRDRDSNARDLTFRSDVATIDPRDNLVTRAVYALRSATGNETALDITLTKRIPVSAGLGGASSNAAATLMAVNSLLNLNLTARDLDSLALQLGSDVPFFLRQGCALGRGRGENLRPLPCRPVWFVVVYPHVTSLPETKTAALFAALSPADLTDGADIFAQAERLQRGKALEPELLGNAFSRALDNLAPETREHRQALSAAGAPVVALSGAGPTHFTVVASRAEADRIAQSYVSTDTNPSSIYVCSARCASIFNAVTPQNGVVHV